MPAIGIDTHKRTLAACAVDEVGAVIDERTFSCDPTGFVELTALGRGRRSQGQVRDRGLGLVRCTRGPPPHCRRVRRP